MNYKGITAIAVPVILANITVPLLGAVDIAMLGHTHNAKLLAAIAIGAMIFDLIFWAFSFLRMTTTGLIAQKPQDTAILLRALLLAAGIGFVLMLGKHPLFYLCSHAFSIKHAIVPYVATYFHVRIFAAIPTLLNYVVTGYLFGKKNTRASLFLVLLTSVTAISLDFMFVYYCNYGITGLAVANLLAQTLAAVVGLYYLSTSYDAFKTVELRQLFCKKAFVRLLKINTDVLIRSLSLLLTFSYFTRLGSQLGAATVAANAILMNLNELMAYALDGFTIALESYIGQAVGEQNFFLFKQSLRFCTTLCVVGALLFSLLFACFGHYLIALMTSIPSVYTLCMELLPWLIGLPLVAIGSFILDGCCIGAMWTKDMRNSMLIALFGFILCAHAAKPLGSHGLWLAFYAFMLLRLVFMLLPLKANIASIDWHKDSRNTA